MDLSIFFIGSSITKNKVELTIIVRHTNKIIIKNSEYMEDPDMKKGIVIKLSLIYNIVNNRFVKKYFLLLRLPSFPAFKSDKNSFSSAIDNIAVPIKYKKLLNNHLSIER